MPRLGAPRKEPKAIVRAPPISVTIHIDRRDRGRGRQQPLGARLPQPVERLRQHVARLRPVRPGRGRRPVGGNAIQAFEVAGAAVDGAALGLRRPLDFDHRREIAEDVVAQPADRSGSANPSETLYGLEHEGGFAMGRRPSPC